MKNMSIIEIISKFKKSDLIKMNLIKNEKMGSYWLTNIESNNIMLDGIHCRTYKESNNFIVRFYHCTSSTKCRLTLQHDETMYSLRYTVHGVDNEIIYDLLIPNFDNLLRSEEEFFQQSLVDDYGELSYSTSHELNKIRCNVYQFLKGVK